MNLAPNEPQSLAVQNKDEFKYEAPAIIYEGAITTRAGSVIEPGRPGSSGDAVDPADLFGDD